MLLPSNRIDHEAELQPIDEDLDKVWAKSKAVSDAREKMSILPERVTESNQNNKFCNKIHLYLANPKGLEKPKVYLKGLRMENGLLMKENWLWVANKGQLQLEVIKKTYDQSAIGHPSMEKMLEIAWCYYYWAGMKKMIQWFIRNCYIYKQAKAVRDMYHSLLQPLLVPKWAWTNITIDFVLKLPKYKAYRQIYDNILMVIDRLSKEKHYISCSEEDDCMSAEVTADLFFQDIWSKHSLPTSMTSDWRSQFVSKIWNFLYKLLRIKAKLFSLLSGNQQLKQKCQPRSRMTPAKLRQSFLG